MAECLNGQMTKLLWREARELVLPVNPALVDEIDELDPSDEYHLYHVRYPYGELVVDQSSVTLPTSEGMFLPFQSSEHTESIRDDLGYAPVIPACVILQNSVELFCEMDDRIKTIFVAPEGSVVGLFPAMRLDSALDRNNALYMTSGVRSMFMIAPIGDNIAHNRLMRTYDIHSTAPKKLLDQWQIFKEICETTEVDWNVEVLYFSKKWFENTTDRNWKIFRHFLFESAWPTVLRESYYQFNELFLSQVQTACNLRADPHLINTAHHLIYLSSGVTPGYTVLHDEKHAPLNLLQDIYLTDYRLGFAPVIMGPSYFGGEAPVYYSLEVPTNIQSTIRSRKRITRIEELREVRRTMTAMHREILRNRLELEDKPNSILNAAKTTQFSYFHTDGEEGSPIKPAVSTLEVDQNMNNTVQKSQVDLCDTNRFFWGCISVTNKHN